MKNIVIILSILFCLSANAQHPYFNVPINEIERTAKNDGYRVTTELRKISEDNYNTLYYLTMDSISITIGYTKDMLLPAFIIYREQ